ESGHAFVAWRAGDTSVVGKGYLSLDPLKYTDLATTIIFPLIVLALGGIGFPGAAVYLRPDLMRSPMGRAMASLAGPAMTGAVLLLLGFGMSLAGGAPTLFQALGFLAFLQATALILNLLPVPGLDGYGVIRPFLP
ncbi:site-2 protease family protein, partial [Mycobacterium tuberculosis]